MRLNFIGIDYFLKNAFRVIEVKTNVMDGKCMGTKTCSNIVIIMSISDSWLQ